MKNYGFEFWEKPMLISFKPGILVFHCPDQIQTWNRHHGAISWPVVFQLNRIEVYLVPRYSKKGNLHYYHHFRIHLDNLICILLHHNHPLSDHIHTIAITTYVKSFWFCDPDLPKNGVEIFWIVETFDFFWISHTSKFIPFTKTSIEWTASPQTF